MEITDAALRMVIAEYTREAGVRNLERQLGTIARKVAARIATRPADAGPPDKTVDRPRPRWTTTSGPARFKKEVAFRTSTAGRGHRRGLDRNRRRRAVHRSDLASRRKPEHHSHGPARQRDAGVGPRGPEPHPGARRGTRDFARNSSPSTTCTSTCRPARSRRTVRRPASRWRRRFCRRRATSRCGRTWR